MTVPKTPRFPSAPAYMSFPRAMTVLGVGPATLRSLVNTGWIGRRSIPGGRCVVRASDVYRLASGPSASPATPSPPTAA